MRLYWLQNTIEVIKSRPAWENDFSIIGVYTSETLAKSASSKHKVRFQGWYYEIDDYDLLTDED